MVQLSKIMIDVNANVTISDTANVLIDEVNSYIDHLIISVTQTGFDFDTMTDDTTTEREVIMKKCSFMLNIDSGYTPNL